VKHVVIAAAVACAALAIAVAPAAATNECHGLQVCVPVAGPWVLATSAGTEFQLDCPKHFIVGGLDAELSSRAIDLGFAGGLGSPVNPGITTTDAAVFLGRFLGAHGVASFRPHIGCVPTSGGGQRTPTAYRVFTPGKPSVRVVKQLAVAPALTTHLVARCAAQQRLVRATYAIAFNTDTPPSARAAQSVHVKQVLRSGAVRVSVRGSAATPASTIVQVDLLCAVAR
jgi:hypothetical protein